MAKAGSKRTPAGSKSGLVPAFGVRVMEAACWLAPIGIAAKVNIDSLQNPSSTIVAFSISTVVLGAFSLFEAIHATDVTKKLTSATVAIFMLGLNFSNALSNLASHSDSLRDSAGQLQQTVTRKRERLGQIRTDRNALSEVAGSETPASIQAGIQSAKSMDAARWKSTDGCNQDKITAGPSKVFCADIANRQAKLEAAARRDSLDAMASALERELDELHAPSSQDSFAEEIASVLELAGHKVGEKGRALISRLRVWAQALGVEVVGEFGPSVLLGILHRLMMLKTHSVPVLTQPSSQAKPKEGVSEEQERVAAVPVEDLLGRFIAECVEFTEGCDVAATPLFEAWLAWCSRNGVQAGSQTAFGRKTSKRIKKESSNGKNWYRGIKLRELSKPALKVVSGGCGSAT